jgi:hypothetical protein
MNERPDDELQTIEEIQERIAARNHMLGQLSRENDYETWLPIFQSLQSLELRLLKQRLKKMVDGIGKNGLAKLEKNCSNNKEAVEDRLLREAKERYEKRVKEAGDNWWEMWD